MYCVTLFKSNRQKLRNPKRIDCNFCASAQNARGFCLRNGSAFCVHRMYVRIAYAKRTIITNAMKIMSCRQKLFKAKQNRVLIAVFEFRNQRAVIRCGAHHAETHSIGARVIKLWVLFTILTFTNIIASFLLSEIGTITVMRFPGTGPMPMQTRWFSKYRKQCSRPLFHPSSETGL